MFRARAYPLTCLLLVATSVAGPRASLGQALPRAEPDAVGLSAERLQRLGDRLDRYVDEGSLPGGVVMISRRGRVAYTHAFGWRDREADAVMSGDAIFRIASQTKALVSTAILILQEEGRLLITDPVGDYIPALAHTTVAMPRQGGGYDVVDARRPITLRDLLTHTAGVGYGGGPAADRWAEAGIQGWYFAHRDEPVLATVERMGPLPFAAQPGERFVYGYSTDILGAVVEVASGQPLDVFLSARVFQPLGMRDTQFYLAPEKVSRLAVVYTPTEDGGLSRAPEGPGMDTQGQYVVGPRRSFSGGAGLLSTAEDYTRFLEAMRAGGALNGVRILSPKSVELMTTNHIGELYGAPGVGFGLGFSVVTDLGARGQPGSVGEFGWGGAYNSSYWVDPSEDLVVVYFTQVRPGPRVRDQATVRALVYQSIVDGAAR